MLVLLLRWAPNESERFVYLVAPLPSRRAGVISTLFSSCLLLVSLVERTFFSKRDANIKCNSGFSNIVGNYFFEAAGLGCFVALDEGVGRGLTAYFVTATYFKRLTKDNRDLKDDRLWQEIN